MRTERRRTGMQDERRVSDVLFATPEGGALQPCRGWPGPRVGQDGTQVTRMSFPIRPRATATSELAIAPPDPRTCQAVLSNHDGDHPPPRAVGHAAGDSHGSDQYLGTRATSECRDSGEPAIGARPRWHRWEARWPARRDDHHASSGGRAAAAIPRLAVTRRDRPRRTPAMAKAKKTLDASHAPKDPSGVPRKPAAGTWATRTSVPRTSRSRSMPHARE